MIINERVNEPVITNDPQQIASSLRYSVQQLNLILQKLWMYTLDVESSLSAINAAMFDPDDVLVNSSGDVLTNSDGNILLV